MSDQSPNLNTFMAALARDIAERAEIEVASVLDKLDLVSKGVEEVSNVYHLQPLWFGFREQVENEVRKCAEPRITKEIASKLVIDDNTKS